ncbi:MAG: type IV pilus secretin PilQ [Gammaproteobacteria bacterium]|uniref:type IV pilus secretin PilQ n=1 Tax=Rhodoferax sp. TaxID=50421 RepID=UPI001831DADE|nr:type IV pilus secretin PilQ [Rhodoferax sp.]MBU3900108.1 type IV pilus secretin PilQ [Gammaproteobacteria bacterium]MBA3059782.1 type IV pilus secretin PilQ [Rhodoferax sp.]MBU3998735.1 type IV pilus secretin PilQ [Gammaproteobacteria bacterium]MBU4018292.1 type IV pilus secretin PilQ [Gammaproteobacteria bacterium]MBU4082146.1 type IV pilus secretin PilQ [Gammaproteobacteria bacterium]
MNHQNYWMTKQIWQRAVTAASLMLLALGAQAQPAIEAVSGSIQSGVEVVRIDLSQPLAAIPTGFSIQSPARIALDFPGVSSAIGRSTVEINQGNLRSVSVVQAGDRTRVVLNLKQATAYKAQLQGKSLLVVLDAVALAAPAASSTPVFAENRSRDTLPLKDLDFRRGDEGSGRVVVSLPSSQVGVDIRQQGGTLVVEFMKSTLPEGMRRRLDVSDFGTPVQTVTTFAVGDRVRMVIEPKGQWVHSAYQTDEQFVVEVRPVKVDPSKLTQGPGYSGQKLSLNFQNIEVRSLLQVIADFTNFNIITSDSVTGSVTLRLQDVPWDQALDIILQAKGLGMRKTGNVLWIAPKDEINAKEKLELESIASLQSLEPLRTQSFQLNYTKAADVAAQLTAGGGGANGSRMLSPRGSTISEARTNQLFVTDIPSKLEQVRELITKLDIPVRQVLIEARIVEASDTFGKSLGVKLGGIDLRAQRGGDGGYQLSGDNRVAFGTSYGNAVASSGAGGVANLTSNFVNLPAIGQGGADPATFALALFSSAANRFLNLELSALEADGKGKIVSSPRVVTADQKEASIEQGVEIPFQKATTSGATAIEFIKANLSLRVTPQITPEGSIIMDVEVNKNSVGQSTSAGLAINTKRVKTQVLVENGGTVVIGGIFELTESENETKVPFFGDLPGVGNLFKSRARTSNKQEMLVFITPKVVTDRATR